VYSLHLVVRHRHVVRRGHNQRCVTGERSGSDEPYVDSRGDSPFMPAIVLRRGTMERRVTPLFCTSAIANIGIQPLLDGILAYAPSPVDRQCAAKAPSGEPIAVEAKDSAPYVAFVWNNRGPVRRPDHAVPGRLRVTTGSAHPWIVARGGVPRASAH